MTTSLVSLSSTDYTLRIFTFWSHVAHLPSKLIILNSQHVLANRVDHDSKSVPRPRTRTYVHERAEDIERAFCCSFFRCSCSRVITPARISSPRGSLSGTQLKAGSVRAISAPNPLYFVYVYTHTPMYVGMYVRGFVCVCVLKGEGGRVCRKEGKLAAMEREGRTSRVFSTP